MASLSNERIAEIRDFSESHQWDYHPGVYRKAIADLLAERESLLADARRWRHVEKWANYEGDWIAIDIKQHPEDPSFAAAVDADIERTAIIKRGGP